LGPHLWQSKGKEKRTALVLCRWAGDMPAKSFRCRTLSNGGPIAQRLEKLGFTVAIVENELMRKIESEVESSQEKSPTPQTTATSSISTSAFVGSPATCTVERAGAAAGKYFAYTSFMAAKSFMSFRNTVVFTT
jgi:hypothetical protein